MAKSNQIQKLVNGEIADADDVNQIVEDAGAEGGSIPYDPDTDVRDTAGAQSLGSVAYPWGSLKVNQDAELVEVAITNHTAASSVAFKNLRKFIYLKDCPSSYSGQGGKFPRVKLDESGLEFYQPSNIQIFTSSGTFTAPSGITKVYLTMISGGGGGASASGGLNAGSGGGSSGCFVINLPFTVTPGNNYTVTVGAGGAAAAGGGTTSFDSISLAGGNAGAAGSGTTGGDGGSGPAGYDTSTITTVSATADNPRFRGGHGYKGANGSGGNGGAGGSSPFGVGGAGATGGAGSNGTAAAANSGGGGGGSASNGGTGGAGGSGIVIVMY